MTAAQLRRPPLSALPKEDVAAGLRRVTLRGAGVAHVNALHPTAHDQDRARSCSQKQPHQMERGKKSVEAYVLVGIEHVAVLSH